MHGCHYIRDRKKQKVYIKVPDMRLYRTLCTFIRIFHMIWDYHLSLIWVQWIILINISNKFTMPFIRTQKEYVGKFVDLRSLMHMGTLPSFL